MTAREPPWEQSGLPPKVNIMPIATVKRGNLNQRGNFDDRVPLSKVLRYLSKSRFVASEFMEIND